MQLGIKFVSIGFYFCFFQKELSTFRSIFVYFYHVYLIILLGFVTMVKCESRFHTEQKPCLLLKRLTVPTSVSLECMCRSMGPMPHFQIQGIHLLTNIIESLYQFVALFINARLDIASCPKRKDYWNKTNNMYINFNKRRVQNLQRIIFIFPIYAILQ